MQQAARPKWVFLTSHALVLLAIARDPSTTLTSIAASVGITDRAVRLIIRDLEEAGYLSSRREGRRKRYRINRRLHLRHPMSASNLVGDLLALLGQSEPAAER